MIRWVLFSFRLFLYLGLTRRHSLQLFFHQYFTQKVERGKAKAAKVKKRKEGKEDDLSDEDEDEEEDVQGGEVSAEEDDASVESDKEQKATSAAGSEVDEDEEASDLEEAEIWRVCHSAAADRACLVANDAPLLGDASHHAQRGWRRRSSHGRQ